MSKFANIKTKWKWAPHNYDPDQTHSNWWTNITGPALRAYYTLNYNMAYYLSSDNFSSTITSNTIKLEGADVKWFNLFSMSTILIVNLVMQHKIADEWH